MSPRRSNDRSEASTQDADEILWRFLQDIGDCSAQAAAWLCLRTVMEGLGARHLTYASGTTLGAVTHLSTLPDAWRQRYRERGYAKVDPIVSHVMRRLEPLLVDYADGVENAGLAPRCREMCRGLLEMAVRSAFVVPIRGTGEHAYGSLVLLTDEPAGELSARLAGRQALLVAIGWAAHARLMLLKPRADGPSRGLLTRREREALRLLAAGFTPDAIGSHLGIGRRTVDLHFRSARDKLGAATREEALSRALTTGEICL